MRKATLFLTLLLSTLFAWSQTVENANVYPSNLEENMYFERFNPSSNTVEGLYFLVLSDGDNSQYATPAFDVSLYLLPEGSTSADDVIIVKNYPLAGIYHMGSHEFSNETINLNATPGIQPGRYRLGIWVNSGESFTEDSTDNATLFKNTLVITKTTTGDDEGETTSPSLWDEEDSDDDWDEESDW